MLRIVIIEFVLIFGSQTGFSQGESLFDDSFLHEIHLDNMDTMLINGQKVYQMANMTFDGIVVDSVGVKDKGNISNNVPNRKLPLKIKTNKYVNGKKYDGIKEFTLHNNFQDPTMMREKLTYEICEQLGLFTLRTAYAKVYINGSYWGLYTIVEGKDEMFKHQFNNRDADAIESLDFGTMCFISNNPDDYNADLGGLPYYQLANGDQISGFQRFEEMIDKANNTSDANYLSEVSSFLNLQHFFSYQAANVYLMNFDSYIGFNGNQIYMYDTLSNIWQVIPWDFNASLNLWDNGNGNQFADTYPLFPARITNGCIAGKLNSIPELREYYLNTMCELTSTYADTTIIINRIDFLKDQIQEAVDSDWRKTYSNQEFDLTTEYGSFNINGNQFEGLKTFFKERYNLISQELIDESILCTSANTNQSNLNQIDITVFPNPSSGLVYLSQDYPVDQIVVYDLQGRKLKEMIQPAFPVNLGGLGSGMFVITLILDGKLTTTKIILE